MRSTLTRRTARILAVVAAVPVAAAVAFGTGSVAGADEPVVIGPSGATTTVQGPFAPAKANSTSANTTSTDVYNPIVDKAGQGGKPRSFEAGSVGRADYKQPKGQLLNAKSDGNNGYECDGNKGIALGNPAHSGCPGNFID